MKILLVEPRPTTSLFSFSEATDITMRPGYMPNLALPTLAALVPPQDEVTIVDESVEPLAPYLQHHWDIVGITGYFTHQRRMFEIAEECRRQGLLVAIGGPFASLSPSRVRPYADVLFIGEAESTWPRFLEDFHTNRWQSEYREDGVVELSTSPLPAMHHLKNDAYLVGMVQTSRGCPFECEFCDVIVYLSRKQRHKAPEQIITELEQLYRLGYRTIFLSDDNFTAYRKKAREITQAIVRWNRENAEPVRFNTQLSIDVVRDPELLDLCAQAGLKQAFVGIETSDPSALREVKKRQNVRPDLVADVHELHRRGIVVQAGMITGFDSDTIDAFRTQYEFLQAAGIPVVLVNMLQAIDGTPLQQRLAKEQRLSSTVVDQALFTTNIVPKQMTTAQLFSGTQWLINKLYDPDNFLARVARLAAAFPATRQQGTISPQFAHFWHNLLRSYGQLGPEFRDLPRRAVQLFRGKDTGPLGTALAFYKHAVRVLQKHSLWDPGLARRACPEDEVSRTSEALHTESAYRA